MARTSGTTTSICLLHRGGRLVCPGWAAHRVADGEGGLERALPQGLGVREQRAGLRDREQAGALTPDDPGLQGPADDKAQAGELGGAAELQALVTGAEQGDEVPGVRGPDVLRRREFPALRAEPLGQGAELGDYLAMFSRGRELLPGGKAHRELRHLPLGVQGGQPGLPGHGGLDYPGIDVWQGPGPFLQEGLDGLRIV